MAKKKKTSGDTTVITTPAMTTERAVEKKEKVVSPEITRISLDELPVCDPGAAKQEDFFVDNIFDTDDYEDL